MKHDVKVTKTMGEKSIKFRDRDAAKKNRVKLYVKRTYKNKHDPHAIFGILAAIAKLMSWSLGFYMI